MSEIQRAIAAAAIHATAQGQGRRGTIPSPVQGWNTRDNVASMRPTYAVELDNYFPDLGRIRSRRGFEVYAETNDSSPIHTIHEHVNGRNKKLFAISTTAVYDITDPENVQTVSDSNVSVSRGRWRAVNFNGNSILVNGFDPPIRFNSMDIWVHHGFSGLNLDAADLTSPTVFKNRLWFIEKDTSDLWYGDLNAITGPLTRFPLGLVDERAGRCVSLGSISMDTGEGVDDLFVAFMESGACIIYAGSDPGDINDWRLAGVYHLGPVVGDNPAVKLGADLIAITTDGYIPLTQFLRGGRAQTQLAVSDLISPTVTEAIQARHDEPGWQAVLYTPAKWLLFNVPLGSGQFEQHVMHTQTASWCRFRGMNAYCWEVSGDRLFFGSRNGEVMEANKGGSDNGQAIYSSARGAYNYFNSPYDKQFKMIRSHIESDASQTQLSVGASVDFSRAVPRLAQVALTDIGARWNEKAWNVPLWAAGVDRSRDWKGLALKGAALSIHIASRTKGDPVTWYSSDILYDQARGAIAGAGQ